MMRKSIISIVILVMTLLSLAYCAENINPYKVLGVSRTASDREIKQAFNKLSKKYHPDKSPQKKVDYERVIAAYELLKDTDKRRMYDQTGSTGNNYQSQPTDQQSFAQQQNDMFMWMEMQNRIQRQMYRQQQQQQQYFQQQQQSEEDAYEYYQVRDQWGNIILMKRQKPYSLMQIFVSVLKWLLNHPLELIGFLVVYYLIMPQAGPARR